MLICTVEDLCKKDVINVCNGDRLGTVFDCEVISENGQIIAILVMPEQPVFSFKRTEPFRVEWNCICVIGNETILIKCEQEPKRKQREKVRLLSALFGK